MNIINSHILCQIQVKQNPHSVKDYLSKKEQTAINIVIDVINNGLRLTIAQIAKLANCSYSTVQRAIRKAKQLGLLETKRTWQRKNYDNPLIITLGALLMDETIRKSLVKIFFALSATFIFSLTNLVSEIFDRHINDIYLNNSLKLEEILKGEDVNKISSLIKTYLGRKPNKSQLISHRKGNMEAQNTFSNNKYPKLSNSKNSLQASQWVKKQQDVHVCNDEVARHDFSTKLKTPATKAQNNIYYTNRNNYVATPEPPKYKTWTHHEYTPNPFNDFLADKNKNRDLKLGQELRSQLKEMLNNSEKFKNDHKRNDSTNDI